MNEAETKERPEGWIEPTATETPEPEPDDDDEGEDDSGEDETPETPDAAPPQPTQADNEAAFKKLDRAAANYGKAVLKALEGSSVVIDKCPCCAIPGLVMPYNQDDINDYDRKLATDAYFGASQPELVQDPDLIGCPRCVGNGHTKTGASELGVPTIPCTRCGGQGFVTKDSASTPVAGNGFVPGTAAVAPQPASFPGLPDAWGRPDGHPRYGQDPNLNGGLW